jgi:hypothetical protein
MKEMRNAYKILVGKPEGKRQLERPKCSWEDNIRMCFRETSGSCGLESSGLGQRPTAVTFEHRIETSDSIKGG